MATVTVLHRYTVDMNKNIIKPMDFSAVALVDVPTDENTSVDQILEYAYRWTQNLEGSWSLKQGSSTNRNVRLIGTPYYTDDGKEIGLRSTSLDDLLILDGKVYKVEFIGFEEINI